nr:pentatricopeptide repeat-containing protein [Tanacetum cinerariifolium]
MIQNEFTTLSLQQFGHIHRIPFNDQAVFTNEWDLGALAYSQKTEGPYHTELPTLEEIHQFLKFERDDSNCIIKSKNVTLSPNQVLTKELRHDLKRWNELIYENVFGLGGHRDHLPACLAHILYCTLDEQQYNLAYFFVKRIESARATPKAHLPYDKLVDPRSDRGKARHCVSSTSANYNRVSSSRQEDDDEDDGSSRVSTPSPTTYLNSLKPLIYQQYEIPSPSEQSDDPLFERQTKLLNQS